VRNITLPVDAQDMAFDLEGFLYLRVNENYVPKQIVRYDVKSWRQIPWDYGEERPGFISILPLPCDGNANSRESGFWVSPRGHIAVTCSEGAGVIPPAATRLDRGADFKLAPDPYQPRLYPGRGGSFCLHIWDRHGKLIHEDAFPGMPHGYGVAIDKSENLYVLASPTRSMEGKAYPNYLPGTLIKVRAGQCKALDPGAVVVPFPKEQQPKRSPDLDTDYVFRGWVEGAEWYYGGVGNPGGIKAGCDCWQKSAQFALDLYARSFAPEIDQFSVAVLDTNGNLILRVGQYGNVDDGVPLDPKGAPPHARSIGGDEVALMQACHVATLSDRYLYIGDTGNARIAKVKLGYHAEEKVALRDVKDEKR
jgi:hypothetical protein